MSGHFCGEVKHGSPDETVVVGPFVDATGASVQFTPTPPNARLIKHDGTSAVYVPTGWAHISNGVHRFTLAAADKNLAGRLCVEFHDASMITYAAYFSAVNVNAYNVKYAGIDATVIVSDQPIDVNVVEVGAIPVSGPNDLKADVTGLVLLAYANTIVTVDQDIKVYEGSSAPQLQWTVLDANDVAIDLSVYADVRFLVYDRPGGTVLFSKDLASGLTVSGAGNNVITLDIDPVDVEDAGSYRYELWALDEGGGSPGKDLLLKRGAFIIQPTHKEIP